jgi:hypothetical protein
MGGLLPHSLRSWRPGVTQQFLDGELGGIPGDCGVPAAELLIGVGGGRHCDVGFAVTLGADTQSVRIPFAALPETYPVTG